MEISGFLLPIRATKKLSASEKLLYIEILCRLNSNGLCATQNDEFAKFFDKDNRTIQRWLEKLKKRGFLKIWFESSTHMRFLEPLTPTKTENMENLTDDRVIRFQNEFPDRPLNNICKLPKDFDVEAVINAIKESDFLSQAKNFGLGSAVKFYNALIAGGYKSFHKKSFSTERSYTKGEINDLYTITTEKMKNLSQKELEALLEIKEEDMKT